MVLKRKTKTCKVNKTAVKYLRGHAIPLATSVFGARSGTVADLRAAAKLLAGAKRAKAGSQTYTRRELAAFMAETGEEYSQPAWRGTYRRVSDYLRACR